MSYQCAIWKTPAVQYPSYGGMPGIDSKRAGGSFRLGIIQMIQPELIPTAARSRLTTWLVDQRRMGVAEPLVTDVEIHHALTTRHLKVSEKIERFFLCLNNINFQTTDTFRISGIVDDESREWNYLFGAWTESERPEGGLDVLSILQDLNYVQPAGISYRVTAQGFDRMEQLQAGGQQFDQGFVAMWFGDEMQVAYEDGFRVGIEAAGYRPMRIDRKEHNNKIDDEIVAEIRRSRFVVADMTCPVIENSKGDVVPSPRGGVYYEAGFAQGLNIPVIWSARRDTIGHVHFDTRQYSHILWDEPKDLSEKLQARIGAVLGYGPHKIGR